MSRTFAWKRDSTRSLKGIEGAIVFATEMASSELHHLDTVRQKQSSCKQDRAPPDFESHAVHVCGSVRLALGAMVHLPSRIEHSGRNDQIKVHCAVDAARSVYPAIHRC